MQRRKGWRDLNVPWLISEEECRHALPDEPCGVHFSIIL